MQEVGCFLWCLVVICVPRLYLGIWPVPFMVHAYFMGVFIMLLNAIRTLGSHRWTNTGEESMTFVDQLLDSVNYPTPPWLSEWWGPVGTRYHALHHLFPSMPYHHLPRAHARLSRQLPADSPYHQTTASSLSSVLLALWHRAGSHKSSYPDYSMEVHTVGS
jgi:fatty acid desaturase